MALHSNVINELTKHKRLSRYISNLYYGIGDRRHAELVESCCDTAYVDDNGEFIRTFFCKDKWCPICAYRKARYMSAKCMELARRLWRDGYKLAFWTFTIPNVKPRCIRHKIDHMNKAYFQLVGRDALEAHKAFIKGSMKCFEVTYNKKRDDFHLHIHALIVYDKNYHYSDNRLNYHDIIERWSDLMGYKKYDELGNRQYLVCKFKNINNSQSIPVVVSEIVKYIFKPSSLLDLDLRNAYVNFNLLTKAFKGMHQFDFQGIIKKYNREFTKEEDLNFHFIQFAMDDVLLPCIRYDYDTSTGTYLKKDRYFFNSQFGHLDLDEINYFKSYSPGFIPDKVIPDRRWLIDIITKNHKKRGM